MIRSRLLLATGPLLILHGFVFCSLGRTQSAGEYHLRSVVLPKISVSNFESDEKKLAFPTAIGKIVAGGGGRYLLCHLPGLRQIAIVDVNQAKISKYLAVAPDDIDLAASANKLVVLYRDKSLVRRYGLPDLKLELTQNLPTGFRPTGLVMGGASNGPLLVPGATPTPFLDLGTLGPAKLTGTGQRHGMSSFEACWASMNGKLFTGCRRGGSPTGMTCLAISGNVYQHRYEHDSNGSLLPNAKGTRIHTARGIFTENLQMVGTKRINNTIPSVTGRFFLTPTEEGAVSVHIGDSIHPLISLPGFLNKQDYTYAFARPKPSLPAYFIPAANVVIVPSVAMDSLLFKRLNIDEALDASEIDYLFIESTPIASVARGKEYQYAVQVKSKRKGLIYSMEAGPEGMTVDSNGIVKWTVPKTFVEDQVSVILLVKDSLGQEVFQSYSVAISGTAAAETLPTNNRNSAGGVKSTANQATNPSPDLVAEYSSIMESSMMVESNSTSPFLRQSTSQPAKIQPAKLDRQAKVTKLPGAAEDVVAAAGGRYLMVSIPSLRQIAVFDMTAAQIVKYIACSGDQILMAASRNHLVVADPVKKLLHCYDLSTFKRRLTTSIPSSDNLNSMVMGCDSDGPLVMSFRTSSGGSRQQLLTVDPKTLQAVETGLSQQGIHHSGAPRVSEDASLVVDGTTVFIRDKVTGNYKTQKNPRASRRDYLPNADGSVLYQNGEFYSSTLQRIGTQKLSTPLVLSVQPGYVLTYDASTVKVHQDGEASLLVLADYIKPNLQGSRRTSSQALMQRLWFVPDAKHVAVFPNQNDRIESYQLDIDALLEDSGVDYLFVAPTKLPPAQLGKRMEHQLPIRSKRGGVKTVLQSGPAGLAVSPSGKIKWDVPADFTESSVKLLFEISESSGRSIFHSAEILLPEAIEVARQKARALAAEQAKELAKAEEMRRLAREKELAVRLQANGQSALAAVDATISKSIERMNQRSKPIVMRRWIDSDGNEINASLVEQFAGIANLRSAQGNTFFAPISRLSTADQAYLKKLTQQSIEKQKRGITFERESVMRILSQPVLSAMRSFSSTSKPKLSWRVQILPKIGGAALYELFDHDSPWDSEHNRKLIPLIPQVFCAAGLPREQGMTCVLALSGEGAAFNNNQFVTMREYLDGVQSSAAVVEVPAEQAQIWTKPVEWDAARNPMDLFGKRQSVFVIAADGKVHTVNRSQVNSLKNAFQIADGVPFQFSSN